MGHVENMAFERKTWSESWLFLISQEAKFINVLSLHSLTYEMGIIHLHQRVIVKIIKNKYMHTQTQRKKWTHNANNNNCSFIMITIIIIRASLGFLYNYSADGDVRHHTANSNLEILYVGGPTTLKRLLQDLILKQ